MREAKIERKTTETDIRLALGLDGGEKISVDTGCGFLDHMLTLFATHGCFDLDLFCRGDVNVDFHHTAEDIGIALGEAFRDASGDRAGIARYASVTLPMDEALVLSAVDVSGRGVLRFNVKFPTEKIGDFDTELVKEFWLAFVRTAGVTLHVIMMDGENSHHIAEAIFKGVARSLSAALCPDPRFEGRVPSSKGVL